MDKYEWLAGVGIASETIEKMKAILAAGKAAPALPAVDLAALPKASPPGGGNSPLDIGKTTAAPAPTFKADPKGKPKADAKAPVKAAPPYGTKGLAEFVPNNDITGLRVYNFKDGTAALDGTHLNALKSNFLLAVKRSTKKYEIVGYASGVGLDST